MARYADVKLRDALKRLSGVGVQNDTGEGRFVTVRGLDSNLVGVTFGGVRVPSTDSTGRHVAFDQIPSGLVSQITCLTPTSRTWTRKPWADKSNSPPGVPSILTNRSSTAVLSPDTNSS